MVDSINTYNEESLHAAVKHWYARDGGETEVRVDGYIVDVVHDGRLIEIQTGSFASIKAKVTALAQTHQVLLAYPVALESWLVQPTPEEAQPVRRKSPKRGSVLALFSELVSFPGLVANPNFEIDVVFTREDILRHRDARRGWRRHGWVIDDRVLLEVVTTQRFRGPTDFSSLLPDEVGDSFTTVDLARVLGRNRAFCQKMVYCLREMNVLVDVGHSGRARLYARRGDQSSPA